MTVRYQTSDVSLYSVVNNVFILQLELTYVSNTVDVVNTLSSGTIDYRPLNTAQVHSYNITLLKLFRAHKNS